ncbi:MAG: hypothetical protein HY231_00335 [Acidobacteria bacterium]|nr:hypothetical protein [Acidobacteriota bacterium]
MILACAHSTVDNITMTTCTRCAAKATTTLTLVYSVEVSTAGGRRIFNEVKAVALA